MAEFRVCAAASTCACVSAARQRTCVIQAQLIPPLCDASSRTLLLPVQANMTRMGRHVLPASEKALFVLNWLARRVRPDLKPYIPDFRRAFDHFCLHAGGHASDAVPSVAVLSVICTASAVSSACKVWQSQAEFGGEKRFALLGNLAVVKCVES